MKKITRILIVLSLLAILASVITVTAFALTTINVVYVTLEEPQVGQPLASPTVPEDANYHISFQHWTPNGAVSGDSSIAQEGVRYTLDFHVNPSKGYSFEKSTILYINGVKTDFELRYNYDWKGITSHVSYSFKDPVPQLALSYDPNPQLGSSVSGYKVTGGNDDQYQVSYTVTPSQATDVFQAGIRYDVTATVNVQPDCEFTKDTIVTINGVAQNVALTPDMKTYTWNYQIHSGEAIDTVTFPQWPTDIQPGHSGETVALIPPANANYTLCAKWVLFETGASVPALEDKNLYRVYYIAEPNEGYYFADNATISVGNTPVTKPDRQSLYLIETSTLYNLNLQQIDTIDLFYDPPKDKQQVGSFTVTTDAPVTIEDIQVYAYTYYNTPSLLKPNATFTSDQSYTMSYTLRVQDGYIFGDTLTITSQGMDAKVYDVQDQKLVMNITYHTISKTLPVKQVELPAFPETVTPGPGGISDIAVPEGTHYTIQQGWIDMRTGQVVENVEAGDVYTLAYIAVPEEGYVFDENTKVTLGGQECLYFAEDTYLVTYRTYDLGAQKLDRVDITLPQLYKGCTPGAATVPQGANYTLMELIWAESTTESFDDSQPVEAVNYNTNIFAVPVLCAGKGYTFTEDTKLFFNGVEVPVVFRYAEGPIMELAGLYGTLTPPTTDGWCQEDNTWVYYVDGQKLVSQWYRDSKDWVYLGADGKMLKNTWQRDSKGWCYLGDQGYMLRSSWLNDGGKWYYLNSGGYMLSSTWYKDSKDWVYLGKDGAMLTNTWQRDSKGWCYLGGNGYMVRNAWVADSVGYCRLDGSGYMVKNKWVHDGYGWAYLDAKGYAVIGDWVWYKDQWFAMGADGYMLSNCWITYKDDVYRLAADGHMLTDQWVDDGKGWSYVDKDGKVPFGSFVRDSKGICYITSGGYIAKEQWIKKDGKQYYADSTGHLLRNTTQQMVGPDGYYGFKYTYKFDSNGVATIVNPW